MNSWGKESLPGKAKAVRANQGTIHCSQTVGRCSATSWKVKPIIPNCLLGRQMLPTFPLPSPLPQFIVPFGMRLPLVSVAQLSWFCPLLALCTPSPSLAGLHEKQNSPGLSVSAALQQLKHGYGVTTV